MSRYKQGIFKPLHTEKYAGNFNNIVYRSSWEFKFMQWADTNESIIAWSSEEVIIPYVSPIDRKGHRYFVDFKIKLRNTSGEIKTYLVEVKPDKQTRKPEVPKKVTPKSKMRYITEMQTWGVNEAKWEAAIKYSKDRGMEFVIITEKELGIK